MKRLFGLYSIISFLLACNSVPEVPGHSQNEKKDEIQQKPLVADIDLYRVDSVFFEYMPDTSLNFTSLKAVSQYNLNKGKELRRFILEHFNQQTKEQKLQVQQAYSLFDERQSYLSFKQLKKEPKTLITLSLLGFFKPGATDDPLKERIAYYDSFPEELKNSDAGKKTFRNLNQYLFKANTGRNINSLVSVTVQDTSGQLSVWPKDFKLKEYNIIDFGASWCGPCRINEWKLNQWMDKLDTSRIGIVGFSVDSKKSEWLKSVREDSLSWPAYLLDSALNNPLVRELEISSIPRNFLVDASGNILKEDVDLRKILAYLMKIN